MRAGDLVRFRPHDNHPVWIGLLLRYDTFLKIGEILHNGHLFYAPGRLIETHQRGKK